MLEGDSAVADNGTLNDNLTQFCKEYASSPFVLRATVFSFIAITNCFGLVGNSLSAYIFTRPSLRSSINTLISGLAAADIAFEITGLVMNFPFGLYYFDGELCPYWSAQSYVSAWVYPLGSIALTASVWTHVLITFERYVAVCHPLKAKEVCTVKFSLVGYGSVFLFSVSFNLCRFWEQQLEPWEDDYMSVMTLTPALKANATYQRLYTMWLYLFVMVLFPLLVLSILNARIIFTLRAAAKKRRGMTSFYVPACTSDKKSRRPTEISLDHSINTATKEGVSVQLLREKKKVSYTDLSQQNERSCLVSADERSQVSTPARETDPGAKLLSKHANSLQQFREQRSFHGKEAPALEEMKHSKNNLSLSYSLKSLNSQESPTRKPLTFRNAFHRQISRRKVRRTSEKEGGREGRTTQMMLVIIFIFLSCNSLSFVLAIVEVVREEYTEYRTNVTSSASAEQTIGFLTDLSNLLISVSPALNSVVYYRYSANYRSHLQQLFRIQDK